MEFSGQGFGETITFFVIASGAKQSSFGAEE
jgi:hypothetical protein